MQTVEYDRTPTLAERRLLAEELNEVTGKIPGYDDVVVTITTDDKVPAPAWFNKKLRTVYIDYMLLDIHGDRRVLRGALLHELGHARYSKWSYPPKMDPRVREIVTLMDEIRVEKSIHDDLRSPGDIRYMFRWLLGTIDVTEWPGDFALSCLWALVAGRYYSGVATKSEIEMFDIAIRTQLTDARVDIMLELLSEAVAFPKVSDPPVELIALAEEWVEMFPDDSMPVTVSVCGHSAGAGGEGKDGEEESGAGATAGDEDGEEGSSGAGSGDGDEEGDEDGESGKDGKKPGAPAAGKFDSSEHVDESPVDAPTEVMDPDLAELLRNTVEAMIEETAREMREEVVLASPIEQLRETINNGRINKAKCATRVPSQEVRGRAARLARTLEQMHLPSVSKMRTSATIPPGRLNGRELVRMGADRSAGRMTAAKPWRQVQRQRTSSKPIRIGCMTDTSGSMGWAETFVAEFAWIIGTAGHKIQARTAAVTYGNFVSPVLLPEDPSPKEIKVFDAHHGTEMADDAAATLEALLHLTHNDGSTKVVFNFSDGHYVHYNESERMHERLSQWSRAGVLVFWVGCRQQKFYSDIPGVSFINVVDVSKGLGHLLNDLEAELTKV